MYLTHITTEGERWDQIAARYYGDSRRYQPIIDANQHVPLTPALPSGLKLAIPVLEREATLEDMPPWMR